MYIRSLLKAALHGWRRPATLALALVAAACVAGACITVRADLTARSRAFTQLMADNPADLETATASAQYTDFELYTPAVTAGTLATSTAAVYQALKPNLPLAPRSQAWGSIVNNGHLLDTPPASLQPPDWGRPSLVLGYFEDYRQHARLVAGRWPAAVAQQASGGEIAEVALTQATMNSLHLKLGVKLNDGTAAAWPGGLTVVVVGEIAPEQPQSAYWEAASNLQSPAINRQQGAPPYWDLGAFVGPDEVGSGILADWDAEVTWTVPFDTMLTADQAADLQRNLEFGLTAATVAFDDESQGVLSLRFDSQIGPLLLAFVDAQSAAELQTAMPEAGLGAIALLALVLLLRWTIELRYAETETLRARGAGLWWLSAKATGESALAVAPVGAVGWAIGVLPRGTLPGSLIWISTLLPLALSIAVGLWTYLRHRAVDRRRAAKQSHLPQAAGYRIARRVVLFLTAAMLCVLSLQQAHAHGLTPATGIDVVSALSPVAAAGLATLVAAAIAPPAIRVLLRPIRAGRGVVALLSLTRMARVPSPALVILSVLSLALCTADLAVALERTPVAGAGAAQESTAADAAQAGMLMHSSLGVVMTILAALAVGTACLVVALVALGDSAERRATAARLSVMGLTGAQQRSLTLVELSAPLALACVCATLAATPLLWVVRPAITQGFTGDPRMTWFCLAVPVLVVIPGALATGLAGAGLARRGPAGTLRRGDHAEGI